MYDICWTLFLLKIKYKIWQQVADVIISGNHIHMNFHMFVAKNQVRILLWFWVDTEHKHLFLPHISRSPVVCTKFSYHKIYWLICRERLCNYTKLFEMLWYILYQLSDVDRIETMLLFVLCPSGIVRFVSQEPFSDSLFETPEIGPKLVSLQPDMCQGFGYRKSFRHFYLKKIVDEFDSWKYGFYKNKN